jgi:hypothetical protein
LDRDLVNDVPVAGALYFVEADWPLIAGSFRHSRSPGAVTEADRERLSKETDGDVDVAPAGHAVVLRFMPA